MKPTLNHFPWKLQCTGFFWPKDLLGKLAGETIQVVQIENFSIHFVTKMDKIVLHADMASIQSIG